MNYDHFEREVLGYQRQVACRAERQRRLYAGAAMRASSSEGASPMRFRVAGALRSLANHLDARPAHLA
jgi:hypothetical protein